MPRKKRLILIDGNALMHRAYHAIPPLTTRNGEMINAVYGFTSVLLGVIKELKPDCIICTFDVEGGTFRDQIYAEYKAGRKKPDQDFYDQIPRIKEVVKTLNIPIVEKKGFEADDVIGSLARQVGKSGKIETIIVTGDLDTLQLVDKHTKVFTLRKGIKDTVIYDEKRVFERYGFAPNQVVDFKGLRGDPSDNIPGVKGIGEKGATELLQNFGSIEKLYKAIEEDKTRDLIKPKIKEKLIAEKEKALMSKKLATIDCEMNIEYNLEDCKWGDYNKVELNNLFRELEFYSLMDRIEKENGNSDNQNQVAENKIEKKYVQYIILDTDKKVDDFLIKLQKQKKFVFQTRSDNEDVSQRDLTGIVFLWEKSPIYFIPLVLKDNKPNLFNTSVLAENSPLEKLKSILEDENYKKIGYHFKHDIEGLASHGINVRGLEFDIMLAAYLLDSGKRDYSKDKIIFDYLGHRNNEEIENRAEIENKIKNASIIAKLSHFFELYRIMQKKLKEEGMEDLFCKIEMPITKVLVKMELNGVSLDVKLLKILSGEISEKIQKLEKKIHTLSGDEFFNINSSQQLSTILFEKMKLPTEGIKKTKTGFSIAAPEMEKLKTEHIIISFISEYKELVKLKNTYVDALPKLVSKKTNRLHTTFNQTITATGRLSSSEPNLQNIPVRTSIGRKIRKAFIAESGRKLVSADYSQIELRVVAMVADDQKMKEIFNNNLDVHNATAAEVNQVPLQEVTAEMRRSAKALNFGIIYGMSTFGFARSAGIENDQAKKFIENYMKRFSGIAKYIEKSKEDARKNGYAETIWGRRRYLPEINASNGLIRSSAERMAINMPIQGAAADIMKIAMLKIDNWVTEYNLRNNDAIESLLQVHDELIFSIKEENVPEATKHIREIMENSHLELDGKKIDFPVPIVVDMKVGDNWEEMKDILTS
ncbi:DNA polymerase I [Candidatus Parcubacteria bacterium]|nr:DNA polymerase I [Candidatus Parcubacteria bacterium]